jgi:hypothetical protein
MKTTKYMRTTVKKDVAFSREIWFSLIPPISPKERVVFS